jgi:ABC-type antimicrobial peptide transport system permease subunit
MFWIIIKVSLRSLWANRLRSILAMLGIIIGVSAVIFVLSLVEGVHKSVMGKIESLGTNLLIIMPGARGTNGVVTGTQQNLKLPDVMALLHTIPQIRSLAPVVRGNVQLKYLGKNSHTSILGTTVTYFPIRNFEIDRGKLFTDAQCEAMERVAVVGPVTAKNLFGKSDPLGETIKVNGINFRIIGILQAKGDQGFFNPDDQVLIPYTVAMKEVLGLDYVQELDVSAYTQEDLQTIQDKATVLLRKRHRVQDGAPDDVNIHNQAEMLSTFGQVNTMLTLLAGGVAGISLLVGGIGIMNIMLVTVTERTREIGVRKAIGAKNRDILRQFLIEASLMSGVGGLIGIVVGIGMAVLLGLLAPFQPIVQPMSVVIAIVFSGSVGIFFGFYPAWRAAKLDPIEALRYE